MTKKRKTSPKRGKKPMKKWNFFKWVGIGLVLFSITTTAFVISDKNSKIEHNLSVLGNGTATVVQIYDPKCQPCKRLKRIVNNVNGEFKDRVQFRAANIATEKGKQFARRYNASYVTLLFFNRKGKHINTLRGVGNKKLVRETLLELTE